MSTETQAPTQSQSPSSESQTTPQADQTTTTPSTDTSADKPAADKQEGAAKDGGEPNKEGDKKESDSLLFNKKDEKPEEADAKADEEADKEDGDKDGDEPIEYKDFDTSKLPEGSEILPEQLEWLKKYGQDHNLSQEDAQALIDKGAEMQQQNLQFWNDTKKEWRDQVKSDPELGGQNLDKSIANTEAVIAKFAGGDENMQEIQDDLILLGLGNKRSFIRLMNNIHKATADDTSDGNDEQGSGKQQQSAAQRWYGGSMKSS